MCLQSDRIDVCTRNNFSESIRTHNCDAGCETVTVFDKNGEPEEKLKNLLNNYRLLKTGRLDFFYRNCAANTTAITGNCHNETSKAITKVSLKKNSLLLPLVHVFLLTSFQEICTCDSNYCNRSASVELNFLGVFLSVLLALLLMTQH